MSKTITWFEIPALDFERARTFYQEIFGFSLIDWPMESEKMAIFPHDRETATGGCVVTRSGLLPSQAGTVVYLNAGENLDAMLERVAEAGGHVVLAKTALPDGKGTYAHIHDTEGNRVGLHAMK
jgi:predicted enzyme related to lactoylglutathione lyase